MGFDANTNTNQNPQFSIWKCYSCFETKSILNQKSLVMMTKMSPITQNFKTLYKEQVQCAHGLNLDAWQGDQNGNISYQFKSDPRNVAKRIHQPGGGGGGGGSAAYQNEL
jgi:hypothetical protein